jgi:endonuclease I/chitodextrinase
LYSNHKTLKMKKTLLLVSLFLTFVVSAQEQYYNDVDLTAEGLTLKENLAVKTIATHTNLLDYTPGVWEALKITDVNPVNSAEVLLVYGFSASGITARTRGINDNSGDNGDWNREHTYPKSLGIPNLGSTGPGADAHHLRPSDVQYNAQRGNKKFANGSGNSGDVSGGWYPGDEWKGDIARMMMYMYIRYGEVQCLPTNVGIGSSANTPDAMIDLFLEWNVEDPVSDFERQRNTHHDSNQTYAQGNRNPFIDNAYLATRIWGGTPAEDYWGIYTSSDSEAPTVPANIALSNISTTSIDVSWEASSDNVAVTKYEVFVDGNLNGNTTSTNYTISNLDPGTSYSITVLAKDIANNQSAQSVAVSASTLTDATAPSIPSNVNITNETGTSFKVNWTASTDNSGVTGYNVYIDGSLQGTTANTSYNVTGLTASTTYSARVSAEDQASNTSAQSTAVSATTTDGSNNIVELFISEYVEGSVNNKALEIANLTSNAIDLSSYSIKKQSNGAGGWINELALSGTVNVNDVFVMIHYQADDQTLLTEADLVGPSSNNGAPVNFNGNDAVGLFKNDVLIDIIGILGETDKNFESMTLRRKLTITTPNTTYTASEWDQYDFNTFDGIGIYDSNTASVDSSDFETFKMYPNPTNKNTLYFKTTKDININIYNALGQIVKSENISENKNNIDISNLSKGIFIIKINFGSTNISKKLIKY